MGNLEFVMGDLVNVWQGRPDVVLDAGCLGSLDCRTALGDLVGVGSAEGIGVGENPVRTLEGGRQSSRLLEIRGRHLVSQALCLTRVAGERPHREFPARLQCLHHPSSLGSGRPKDRDRPSLL